MQIKNDFMSYSLCILFKKKFKHLFKSRDISTLIKKKSESSYWKSDGLVDGAEEFIYFSSSKLS